MTSDRTPAVIFGSNYLKTKIILEYFLQYIQPELEVLADEVEAIVEAEAEEGAPRIFWTAAFAALQASFEQDPSLAEDVDLGFPLFNQFIASRSIVPLAEARHEHWTGAGLARSRFRRNSTPAPLEGALDGTPTPQGRAGNTETEIDQALADAVAAATLEAAPRGARSSAPPTTPRPTLNMPRTPARSLFGRDPSVFGGDHSSSRAESPNDALLFDPEAPVVAPDDLDDAAVVAAQLAAPPSSSRGNPFASALGERIADRATAWRAVKKADLREHAQRSDIPLPVDLREAIIREEFVDFEKAVRFNPATVHSRPIGDPSLQLLVEAPSPSSPVTTYIEWATINDLVTRYTLVFYPFRAEELAAYTAWFQVRCHRTPHLTHRYIKFDAIIRRHLGLIGYPDTLDLAPHAHDLLQEIVHATDTLLPPRPSSSALPPRPNKREAPSYNVADQICRRWNHGDTTHVGCERKHICSSCDSPEHIARDCTSAGGGGGGQGGSKKKKVGGGGGGGAGGASARSLRQ